MRLAWGKVEIHTMTRMEKRKVEGKRRKDLVPSWLKTLDKYPNRFTTDLHQSWPLPALLGGQYVCDIPLTLAALHLNRFLHVRDINYVVPDIYMPFFNSQSKYIQIDENLIVVNNHYFDPLYFEELEEIVRANKVPYMPSSPISVTASPGNQGALPIVPKNTSFVPNSSAGTNSVSITDLIILGLL
jgi:hypothetical protein